VLHDATSAPALARALEAAGHDPAPVVCAPLRTARGLHAALLVYLDPGAPAPGPALLDHLAGVADALALAIVWG
jgi:hypothetical protein